MPPRYEGEVPRLIRHMTDDDLYKFTMACAIIDNFPRAQVRYRFEDRSRLKYPEGFAEEVIRQLKMLEDLRMTDEEIAFMRRKCYYLPEWFFTFMRGFRYDSSYAKVWQEPDGELRVEFEGPWSETVLLEVKTLAIISELYYITTHRSSAFDQEKYYDMSYKKALGYLESGCVVSEFGTRRRASFETQETAVRAFVDAQKRENWKASTGAAFAGTSNVYLAMKYDLTPIGTMAHEFVAAIAGMYGGPTMANYLAMKAWQKTYSGDLGIYLYDTYGFDIFALNFSKSFANEFYGLRVDSGDNFKQLDKICAKYKSLGVDPRTKQVVFSNALDLERASYINEIAKDRCKPSFGIGTSITNDWRSCGLDVEPMNIVIKLVGAKITESWPYFNDTCKLSEDLGKHTGDKTVVKRFMETLPEYEGVEP